MYRYKIVFFSDQQPREDLAARWRTVPISLWRILLQGGAQCPLASGGSCCKVAHSAHSQSDHIFNDKCCTRQ